ncbi:hypothetical protein [Mesobacillus boroniphilus]|uniref:Uncharacterized protein n=1 Tax=Mesobacillus boroniphilus JCM 21738 TaxID=1294265 RepID=W4RU89_9BACI|nr:hypothetical protein [Mesobacillus boroniphilus]GAE47965.1 hypothetical protein JCM21738_5012 [Mesobacillus boroniphilus JCM 21738]
MNNANDSNVYIFDRQTEKLTHATPHEGDIQNIPQAFCRIPKAFISSLMKTRNSYI